MSRQEYKALAMGKTIISSVDHAKRGFKSTAKGICFGIGDYEQAKKVEKLSYGKFDEK